MYFPSDWSCKLGLLADRELICVVPEGINLDNFMFVGKKAWLDQREIIDLCEDAGWADKAAK